MLVGRRVKFAQLCAAISEWQSTKNDRTHPSGVNEYYEQNHNGAWTAICLLSPDETIKLFYIKTSELKVYNIHIILY